MELGRNVIFQKKSLIHKFSKSLNCSAETSERTEVSWTEFHEVVDLKRHCSTIITFYAASNACTAYRQPRRMMRP